MPSSSEAQARTMAAAAHDPGFAKRLGIPQKVATDFNQSDKGSALLSNAMRHRHAFGGGIGGGFGHMGGGSGFHMGSGESLGHGIPQIAKPMSMGQAVPPWERSEARQITATPHGIGGRGHFAVGGAGQMSMGMADPSWTRSEARQINDVPFHGSGLIGGAGFGRTDRIPLAVGAESHVIPSDAVSAPGQGSTTAGSRAWLAAIKSGPFGVPPPTMNRGHGPPAPPHAPSIGGATSFAEGGRPSTSILAASGELVVSPEDVEAIGQRGIRDGRAKRGESAIEVGHRLLDEAIEHIRQWHRKWLASAPPPKK